MEPRPGSPATAHGVRPNGTDLPTSDSSLTVAEDTLRLTTALIN
jgi:hypothetical protein